MNAAAGDLRRPIVVVSFDDTLAARFCQALADLWPCVHISPLLHSFQASVESLQPIIVVFDVQTTRTETHSIFDTMETMDAAFPLVRKIALGHLNISTQVVAAMRAGACDFLDQSASLAEIREAIAKHLRHSHISRNERAGFVTATLSGRENDGAESVSANLAVALATQSASGNVLLLDLDLERSQMEIDFNVEVTYSVRDAIGELLRLDSETLATVLSRHRSGLFLLPLTTGTRREGEISPQELATLIGSLRNAFSHIVVNAGCVRDKACQPLLMPLFDRAFLVCPQRIGAVREARNAFSDHLAPAASSKMFTLIVPGADPAIDLSPKQIGASLGLSAGIALAPAAAELANSHNAGTPLILTAPRHPFAKTIRKLAADLLEESGTGTRATHTQWQRLSAFAQTWMRMSGAA